MKKMSTIKYPNQTEAYEIVDATARLSIDNKADIGHTHKVSEISDFAHEHDERYYTELETDAKLDELKALIDENANAIDALGGANANIVIDATLTQEGQAADAKAVGDAISALSVGSVTVSSTADINIKKWFHKKIVVDGSSITKGETGNTLPTWSSFLKDMFALDAVYNHAVSGTGWFFSGSSYVVDRVDAYEADADAVILMGDYNGIYSYTSSAGTIADEAAADGSYYAKLKYLAEKLITKYPLCPIIWVVEPPRASVGQTNGEKTPMSYNSIYALQSKAIEEVADCYGFTHCNLMKNTIFRPWIQANYDETTSDGTHPWNNIQRTMAQVIAETMKRTPLIYNESYVVNPDDSSGSDTGDDSGGGSGSSGGDNTGGGSETTVTINANTLSPTAGYLNGTSIASSDTQYYTADYLPVIGGTDITLAVISNGPKSWYVYYDANKEYLGHVQGVYGTYTYALPETAAYIRFNIGTDPDGQTITYIPRDDNNDDSGDGSGDETEVTLTGITATFTQGDTVIKTTDELDVLRNYLRVVAIYSDLSEAAVTDYTLSGELTEGTSTITVTYGTATTTFDVNVTLDDGSVTVALGDVIDESLIGYYFANNTGGKTAREGMRISQYLPVQAGTNITLSGNLTYPNITNHDIVYYDASQTKVGYANHVYGTTTFAVPEGTSYFRMSFDSTDDEKTVTYVPA